MAFLQFPNIQYFRIIETGNECGGGYFNVDDGTELKHIMATIYIQGVAHLGGSEEVRINLYGKTAGTTPIASSDWMALSDIDPVPSGPNWIGNIYFDFDSVPINPNTNYYFRVEARNYTRNTDTFYVSINLDWYSPVNNQLSATEAGFRVRILGNR